MKNRFKSYFITALAMSMLCPALLNAAAVEEAFTYQGQLKQDGAPANGAFDLRFRLFNDSAAVVSGPLCFDGVEVINGLFTVDLDFGSIFDGNARELEVAVRAGGAAGDCASGVYTVLSPRQPIIPAPYAIHAMNAPNGHSLDASDGDPIDALAVNAIGDVGIGTATPGGRVHIIGAAPPPPSQVGANNGLLLGSNGTSSYKWIQSYGGPLSLNLMGNFVGIGTSTPTARLHLGGTAGVDGLKFPDGTLQTTASTADGHSLNAADGSPVDALFVGNTGNVGIGTSAPEANLHVFRGSAGTIAANGNAPLVVENSTHAYINILTPDANESGILFGRPGSVIPSAAGGILFNSAPTTDGLQFRNGGNQIRMVLDSVGNLGLGTAFPAGRLHITGAASPPPSQTGANNGLLLGSNGELSYKWIQSYGGPLALNAQGNFVGIGTSTPGFPLTFANALGDKISLWGQSGNHYGLGIQSGLLQIHTDVAASDIAFGFGSSAGFTERMRITGDGDLGIGTSAPATRLDVVKPTTGESVARFRQSSAGIHTAISIDSLAGQDPILYLTENGTAQWGIRSDASAGGHLQIRYHQDGSNSTALEFRKHPSADTFYLNVDVSNFWPVNDNYAAFGDATHRWKTIWAANAFIQTSDARQKKDVAPLDYGLKELLSLRPVSFKWKKDSDSTVHLGLISQEVEPIVPEAVVKDEANPETPWAMTYTTLIPVLIKAVQEQQGIIDGQRNRLEELKTEKDARITELEARIARLEAFLEAR